MDPVLSDTIDRFFTQFKHKQYKKGEILVRAEDVPPGVFYLKDGFVKQYAITKKGDEVVVNVFKPIAFFPMSWAINRTPNPYFFEAMTELDLWIAPRDEVLAFIKSNPDVLYNLLSRVYRGVDGVLARMLYLMSGSAYARLITELLIYAKRFGKGEDEIEIQISENDLAAQCGMTRETVSREMKILKDKGLVLTGQNKFVIKGIEKLEKALAEVVW